MNESFDSSSIPASARVSAPPARGRDRRQRRRSRRLSRISPTSPPLLSSSSPRSSPPHPMHPVTSPLFRPLLVASLGNPPPHTNTLHSAGHLVISALAAHLACAPFTKSAALAHGAVTITDGGDDDGGRWTLWKSPNMMNTSGKAVLRAWRGWSGAMTGGRLVVLHDELEAALGSVQVRSGQMGARGHNGLRSLKNSFTAPGLPWVRIGIGIGRPERGEGNVSDWVLRDLTKREAQVLRGEEVVERVLAALRRIEKGQE
ncbi:MAG: aminoacyl-tRNA hydrolase [Piccolia ochrophora]|nr:MAG: aminoacyl-tRNA hydrolase [Piccolia ochrophora]